MVLVSTLVAAASARSMAYGPGVIRMVSEGRNAPNRGYAPQSCRISSRYAVTRPSRRPPMVTVWRCARPCAMATRFSCRVSAQRAGRPSWRAAQHTTACSGSAPNLAPNAPPTSGVMTRIAAGSSPSIWASTARVDWAPWFGIQAVSRPPSQAAAAARASIGAGAIRWFSMVALTTASQPSNRLASSAAAPNLAATLVPRPGNSKAAVPSAAAAGLTTGGSGS